MIAGDREVPPAVADLMDLRRVREDPPIPVPQDRPILPTPLEELVENFDVFRRDLVAVVMALQAALADIPGSALQVGRDDVPSDPALVW